MIAIKKNSVIKNGKLEIGDLPFSDNSQVEVIILQNESAKEIWDKMCVEFQKNDPFEGMSEEEIINELRRQRDENWDKNYAHKFGY